MPTQNPDADDPNHFNRRMFLKAVGAGTAATAAPAILIACATAPAEAQKAIDHCGEPPNPAYVVVRFTRALEPYDDGEQYEQERLKGWRELREIWERVSKEFPNISLRPLFRSLRPAEVKALIAEAEPLEAGDQHANFFAYFQVLGPPDTRYAELASRLREYPDEVETAYVEQIGLSPGVNPGTANAEQVYLDPAPRLSAWFGGIDAKFAWAANGGNGGDGAGIKIIDLERGWFLGHEDFPTTKPALLNAPTGKIVRGSAQHGTSVLGILCMQDRLPSKGGVGLAPHAAAVNCVSYVYSIDASCNPVVANLPDAIMFAASKLNAGDVLLIEAVVAGTALSPLPSSTSTLWVPVEANDANRDAIKTYATARRVTVVEPGGNGTSSANWLPALDMDTWPHPLSGKRVLFASTSNLDYRDCGAIMVSGASVTSSRPPFRKEWAAKGRRVDCYAHVGGVYTTTTAAGSAPATSCSTNMYQPTYELPPLLGTSAAAAIIAGAVASIQGIRRAKGGTPFTPTQIRAMLKHQSFNTQVFDAPGSTQVAGYMPDLARIIPYWLP